MGSLHVYLCHAYLDFSVGWSSAQNICTPRSVLRYLFWQTYDLSVKDVDTNLVASEHHLNMRGSKFPVIKGSNNHKFVTQTFSKLDFTTFSPFFGWNWVKPFCNSIRALLKDLKCYSLPCEAISEIFGPHYFLILKQNNTF